MYYVKIEGKVCGPFSLSRLRTLLAEGRIEETSQFSIDKMQWSSVSELVEPPEPESIHAHASRVLAVEEAPDPQPWEKGAPDGCPPGLRGYDQRILSYLQGNVHEARHAGFWFRLLAYLIDSVLLGVVLKAGLLAAGFVFGFFYGLIYKNNIDERTFVAMGEAIDVCLPIIMVYLWFALFESSKWQATPGKRVLGLKVTTLDGGRVSPGQASGRYWAKLLSVLPFCLGFLWIVWDEKKQGFHDHLSGCLVVKDR